MLEVLVLSFCIGQFECGTALKAYYNEKPHLKSYARKKIRRARDMAGDRLAYAVAPVVVLAAGGTAQIKISRQFSCGGGDDKFMCFFNRSF